MMLTTQSKVSALSMMRGFTWGGSGGGGSNSNIAVGPQPIIDADTYTQHQQSIASSNNTGVGSRLRGESSSSSSSASSSSLSSQIVTKDDLQRVLDSPNQFYKMQRSLREQGVITHETIKALCHRAVRQRLDEMKALEERATMNLEIINRETTIVAATVASQQHQRNKNNVNDSPCSPKERLTFDMDKLKEITLNFDDEDDEDDDDRQSENETKRDDRGCLKEQ